MTRRILRAVCLGNPDDPNCEVCYGELSKVLPAWELVVADDMKDIGTDGVFLGKAEAIIISPFCKPNLELFKVLLDSKTMPNLKWVHSMSAGVDSFVKILDELRPEISLTNVKGAFSTALAEWSMFGIMYFHKSVPKLMRHKAEKKWERYQVGEVKNRKVGLVGFGSIAKECARQAHVFGMEVFAVRRNRHTELEKEFKYVKFLEKDEIFSQCDFIICSLPGTPETYHYCDEMAFSAMKVGSIFVSIGRGSCVDERALLNHIDKMAGAVLDVFEVEPLPQDSPLWTHDKVLLSPHNADLTHDMWADACFVSKVRFDEFESGRSFAQVVDKKAGY